MNNSQEQSLVNLNIYQKSLDIFKMSRYIASYITDDKTIQSMYNSVRISDRYADSLVMNALGLVPKIVETETQENPSLKLKYAISLRWIIDRLYQDCIRLESARIQGKDFVRMLRKEIILLKLMHKKYLIAIQ